jgi:hypothetical protein
MLASALSSFGYAEPFFLEPPKVSTAQSTNIKDFFYTQETQSISPFDEIPDGFEWGKNCK